METLLGGKDMFIRKKEDTVFGFGQVGDDKLLGYVGEFEHGDNHLIKKLTLPTYVNEDNGDIVYIYKDKIVTFKELQTVYLTEYYSL